MISYESLVAVCLVRRNLRIIRRSWILNARIRALVCVCFFEFVRQLADGIQCGGH